MKEYDCSKILDYTHEVQRFCKAQKTQGCDNCPLMKDAGYCSASIFNITQERINFIQKWSDKHREKGKEDALIKKVIEVDKLFGKDIEVDELFGRFIVAFEFMDADWRRCVLQFLTVMNDQLSEGKNE